MALSSVSSLGDGSNKNFSVSFLYLSKNHVKAFVNGVANTAFTWLTGSTIQFTVAPANGAIVLLQRLTPTSPLVDFVDGSTLTEDLLDTATLQALYVSEESADSLQGLLQLDTDNTYNAGNRRIKNVANPVNNNDAVNKVYADTNLVLGQASVTAATTQVGLATAQANTATAQAVIATTQASISTNAAASIDPSLLDITTTKVHATASKTTPVDADEIPLLDSASSFSLKKLTVANLKALFGLAQSASSIPTTGSYIAGQIVFNNASTLGEISGWKRVTTGSGHVLGTDWKTFGRQFFLNNSATDIRLEVGEQCFYTPTAVTSLPLMIATYPDEVYEIVYYTSGTPVPSNNTCVLQMNNTTYGTTISAGQWYTNFTSTVGGITNIGSFPLAVATVGGVYNFRARASTSTGSKQLQSEYRATQSTIGFMGLQKCVSGDLTTPWTSLGTINFVDSTTGRAYVKRIA